MVLLWRADDSRNKAGLSPTHFSGADADDVKRFFFTLETVLVRGIEEDEKPFKLL